MKDDKNIKVSFLLPVHNVKQYIGRCMESFSMQNLADSEYEIICIDDCSTDDSYDELVRLSQLYPRMKVVRNETNRGVSFTRNRAVELASGEYVWFVDPDDFLTEGAAGTLLHAAQKSHADIAVGRVISFPEGHEPENIRQGPASITIADKNNPVSFYNTDQYGITSCGIWLGLLKRQFLIENHLRFREDMKLAEDVLFIYEMTITSGICILVDYYTYCYRLRGRSATHDDDESEFHKRYYEGDRQAMDACEASPKSLEPENQVLRRDFMLGRQQNCIHQLVKISDHRFVRAALRDMKSKGYYPYENVFNSAFRGRSGMNRYLHNEVCFWGLHFAYCAKMQMKRIKKKISAIRR